MSDDLKHTAIDGGHAPLISESWLSRHAPYILLLAYLYYWTQIGMEILGDWWDLFEMLPIMANALVLLMVAALVGVALRVVGQVVRRASGTTILRNIFGEPNWWRTWYPRTLRNPGSVWDRLPPALKVMRTAVWLGLLLLPAGFILVVFVLPTFEAVYASLGSQLPSMMRTYMLAVTVAGYVLPVIMLAALVQASRWHTQRGLPRWVALNALLSVSEDFWRNTEARKLLC
jgi:hypothetical protein